MSLIQKTIRDLVRQIAEEFQPEQIILFGSHAYGHPTEDSDLDLLVVMSFEGSGARKSPNFDAACFHAQQCVENCPNKSTSR